MKKYVDKVSKERKTFEVSVEEGEVINKSIGINMVEKMTDKKELRVWKKDPVKRRRNSFRKFYKRLHLTNHNLGKSRTKRLLNT